MPTTTIRIATELYEKLKVAGYARDWSANQTAEKACAEWVGLVEAAPEQFPLGRVAPGSVVHLPPELVTVLSVYSRLLDWSVHQFAERACREFCALIDAPEAERAVPPLVHLVDAAIAAGIKHRSLTAGATLEKYPTPPAIPTAHLFNDAPAPAVPASPPAATPQPPAPRPHRARKPKTP